MFGRRTLNDAEGMLLSQAHALGYAVLKLATVI